jgi:hypothetical protein
MHAHLKCVAKIARDTDECESLKISSTWFEIKIMLLIMINYDYHADYFEFIAKTQLVSDVN